MERVFQLVIDIGVGRGGDYIKHDYNPRFLRIGLDRRTRNLKDCSQRYGIPGIYYDLEEQKPLPIQDCFVDLAEIYFPHDAVLVDLLNPNSFLWKELSRVLRPNGGVYSVIDQVNGQRFIELPQASYLFHNVDELYCQAADWNGFATITEHLDNERLARIGSFFARKLKNMRQRKGFNIDVFQFLSTRK